MKYVSFVIMDTSTDVYNAHPIDYRKMFVSLSYNSEEQISSRSLRNSILREEHRE